MIPYEIKNVEKVEVMRVEVDVNAYGKKLLVHMIPYEEYDEIGYEFFVSESPFFDMHHYTGMTGTPNGLIQFAGGAAYGYARAQAEQGNDQEIE